MQDSTKNVEIRLFEKERGVFILSGAALILKQQSSSRAGSC